MKYSAVDQFADTSKSKPRIIGDVVANRYPTDCIMIESERVTPAFSALNTTR